MTWHSWRRTAWRTENKLSGRYAKRLSRAQGGRRFSYASAKGKTHMPCFSMHLIKSPGIERNGGVMSSKYFQYGRKSSLIGGFWQGYTA